MSKNKSNLCSDIIITKKNINSLNEKILELYQRNFKKIRFIYPIFKNKNQSPNIIFSCTKIEDAIHFAKKKGIKVITGISPPNPFIPQDLELDADLRPMLDSHTSSEVILSVVVPVYNRKNIINLCLVALMNQTLRKDMYEIIIIDDGSYDGTDKDIKAFFDEYHSPNFKYFYWPKKKHKLGDFRFRAGNARNIGIMNARGSIILFLDSDIIACPNLLREHIQLHKRNKKCIVMGHRIYLKNSKGLTDEIIKSNFEHINTYPSLKNILKYRILEEGKKWEHLSRYWSIFSTNNLSVKKQDIIDTGLFDKTLVLYGIEDTELGYRFYNQGYKFIYNNNAIGYHIPHKSERKNKMLEKKHQRLNLDFFYKKHLDKEIINAFTFCLTLTEYVYLKIINIYKKLK